MAPRPLQTPQMSNAPTHSSTSSQTPSDRHPLGIAAAVACRIGQVAFAPAVKQVEFGEMQLPSSSEAVASKLQASGSVHPPYMHLRRRRWRQG